MRLLRIWERGVPGKEQKKAQRLHFPASLIALAEPGTAPGSDLIFSKYCRNQPRILRPCCWYW
jgi:hypothetical protein